MNTFTASNTATVEKFTESLEVKLRKSEHWLEPWIVQALREFFQNESDEELVRWRWPENPEYVVYSFAPNNVRVFREGVGKSLDYMNEGSWPSAPSDYSKAARAYFESHPQRKPWSDAAVGEVWAVTIDGVERALLVDEEQFTDGNEGWYFAEPEITAARRIWPEEDVS